VKHEFYEYVHAVLGAVNGLCIAFILSYNSALVKIGLTSIKDVIFLLISSYSTSFNLLSVFVQVLVSFWVTFKGKINKQHQEDFIEKELDIL